MGTVARRSFSLKILRLIKWVFRPTPSLKSPGSNPTSGTSPRPARGVKPKVQRSWVRARGLTLMAGNTPSRALACQLVDGLMPRNTDAQ